MANFIKRIKRQVAKFDFTKPVLPKDSPNAHMLGGLLLDHLIKHYSFKSVLDIGSGTGRHANLFETAGKDVIRLDYGKSRAFSDDKKVIIGDFIHHEFEDTFDLVWASHVLEHTIYTHEFLQKMLVVAAENGLVAITVPPAKAEFVGGHVSLWTPAMLLYRMVLAGFDCSQAEVLVYGYNISVACPAVRNSLNMENLAWDLNDVERLKPWLPEGLGVRDDGARFGTVYRGAQIFVN